MADDPYLYGDIAVLRNKLGIRDEAKLAEAELAFASVRMKSDMPHGQFDLGHLCAIHLHLFQDLYEWAGKIRSVDLTKGESRFMPASRIEMAFSDIHSRLKDMKFLHGLSGREFAVQAATIIGDVNYVHPFREGNGRTQLLYLDQLARQAGHPINLLKLEREPWIEASIRSHGGDYGTMHEVIRDVMVAPDAVHEHDLGIDR